MKKKLKSDLEHLANQILNLDSDSDYTALKLKAQKIYEALAVMAYVEASYESSEEPEIVKPDEPKAEVAPKPKEPVAETPEIQPTLQPKSEESDLERIARIAAQNQELFERLRKSEEAPASFKTESKSAEPEEKINQASLHEPVMEKIKDIVAQMPPEADAIEHMFQQITAQSQPIKNDKDDIGEYGRLAEFEEQEKPAADKPKTLNDRGTRGLSFGLNDRIAFIKHLFNGSTADYNRVLSQLNTANAQEEAFNLIDQMVKPDYNYWEGKEVYEARFKELVARKFD